VINEGRREVGAGDELPQQRVEREDRKSRRAHRGEVVGEPPVSLVAVEHLAEIKELIVGTEEHPRIRASARCQSEQAHA
jgi:hypothetical protein